MNDTLPSRITADVDAPAPFSTRGASRAGLAGNALGVTLRMKAPVVSLLLLFAVAHPLRASEEDMPFITARLNADQKRVEADVTAGTITRDDADKLETRISHVRNVVDSESRMTRETRRTMRQDLDRIEKDIADKETGAKSSPSATP